MQYVRKNASSTEGALLACEIMEIHIQRGYKGYLKALMLNASDVGIFYIVNLSRNGKGFEHSKQVCISLMGYESMKDGV